MGMTSRILYRVMSCKVSNRLTIDVKENQSWESDLFDRVQQDIIYRCVHHTPWHMIGVYADSDDVYPVQFYNLPPVLVPSHYSSSVSSK